MKLNPVKQKGFKLLTKVGGRLLSYNVPATDDIGAKFCVEYKQGQIVRPSVGDLFVFAKESHADTQMVRFGKSSAIWEVETYGAHEPDEVVYPIWHHGSIKDIKLADVLAFWQSESKKDYCMKVHSETFAPPNGTFLCRSLRLVRCVYQN